MNYSETLDYLYSALPMFHRVGAAAYKPDLSNTIALCRLTGNPHLYIKTIHVAGTNGKGSVSNMLASILQEAGYKTGLYTSPHLKDFRERIRVNGEMISRKFTADFVSHHKNGFDKIKPSFFEMTVALAFSYFLEKKVDIAVIEAGLGGRLDSTNVITPELSVITNVGMDHMNLLGETVEKIAVEKAGIIKPRIPVVLGEEKKATASVFKRIAEKNKAPLFIASRNYKARLAGNKGKKIKVEISHGSDTSKYVLDLTGHYQLKNAATALQCVEVLRHSRDINEKHVKAGLANVKANTGFAGRWHILGSKPLIIADTGHNPDGIREILKMIKSIPREKLHFVLGMVNDKDIASMLKLLPKNAEYYFCKADIPRGMDASLLRDNAAKYKLKGNSYGSVKKALKQAIKNAKEKDLIFVGGSTFTVAEVI